MPGKRQPFIDDLVLVEWDDAHSPAGKGWHDLTDIPTGGCRVLTVGWCVTNTGTHMTIIPHVSGGFDLQVVPRGMGAMTIPVSRILKTTVLRKGHGRRIFTPVEPKA